MLFYTKCLKHKFTHIFYSNMFKNIFTHKLHIVLYMALYGFIYVVDAFYITTSSYKWRVEAVVNAYI